MSVDIRGQGALQDLKNVRNVPPYSDVVFLLRSDWVRPAYLGEVPPTFEQVIEENGPERLVPESATAVARTLYGILLRDPGGNPCLAISVDEYNSASLRR